MFLLSRLLNRRTSCLGVHIDINAVRLIEISWRQGRYRVEGISYLPLEAGVIEPSGKIVKMEPLVYALRLAKEAAHGSASCVATAVPGSCVITKTVQMMASLSKVDREAQAWVEAGNCFPYALKELMLDFFVLGPSSGNAEKMDVLLVAVHAEDVQPRIDALSEAGIKPNIVDADYFVLAHACKCILENNNISVDEVIACTYISESSVKLIVFHKLRMIYTREINFENGSTTTEGQSFVGSLQEMLATHTRRTIDFFYSASEVTTIKVILLSGASSALEGLPALVEKATGIHTIMANPFLGMDFGKNVNREDVMKEAPNLLVACGLALRGIRL